MAHHADDHGVHEANAFGVAGFLLIIFLTTLAGHLLFVKEMAAKWAMDRHEQKRIEQGAAPEGDKAAPAPEKAH